MQRHFARLDDALIEHVFQPVSDSLMQRFGLDRLRAACFCLDGASLAWILSQAAGLSDAVMRWDSADTCMRGSLLLLGLVAMASLRMLFQRVARSGKASPLRLAMLPHRGIALALLAARIAQAGGPAALADMAMLGLAAVALYLSACMPRPPVRRGTAGLSRPAAGLVQRTGAGGAV